MTDLERIRELELEIARLKGENEGLKLGMEVMKMISQPAWPQLLPYPVYPVPQIPTTPYCVTPIWWTTTCGEGTIFPGQSLTFNVE